MDYQKLITSEHANRPKYAAMVAAVTGAFSGSQGFLASLLTEFDVDVARWTQLDAIGARVGLDRNLKVTTPGQYGQALPAGVVPLSDSDYQVLLRGKIGANQWNGTIAGAYTYVRDIFGGASQLFIIDNQDMSIVIGIAGAVPSAGVKAAVAGGYMQVRPAGVSASYLFPTAPGGPLFGFGTDNAFVGGFGHGVFASST